MSFDIPLSSLALPLENRTAHTSMMRYSDRTMLSEITSILENDKGEIVGWIPY
ncbi:hypothetical protein [Alkalihalobacillus sp. BA299]|uniref:hypothetical protein n=1 Tax=Alkalihalobacillus sp. BA299 TaxID=2815938 RepID=UPI001FFE08D9|nr:hypothetical protein [Alkalihalobacillus sp. BA299]